MDGAMTATTMATGAVAGWLGAPTALATDAPSDATASFASFVTTAPVTAQPANAVPTNALAASTDLLFRASLLQGASLLTTTAIAAGGEAMATGTAPDPGTVGIESTTIDLTPVPAASTTPTPELPRAVTSPIMAPDTAPAPAMAVTGLPKTIGVPDDAETHGDVSLPTATKPSAAIAEHPGKAGQAKPLPAKATNPGAPTITGTGTELTIDTAPVMFAATPPRPPADNAPAVELPKDDATDGATTEMASSTSSTPIVAYIAPAPSMPVPTITPGIVPSPIAPPVREAAPIMREADQPTSARGPAPVATMTASDDPISTAAGAPILQPSEQKPNPPLAQPIAMPQPLVAAGQIASVETAAATAVDQAAPAKPTRTTRTTTDDDNSDADSTRPDAAPPVQAPTSMPLAIRPESLAAPQPVQHPPASHTPAAASTDVAAIAGSASGALTDIADNDGASQRQPNPDRSDHRFVPTGTAPTDIVTLPTPAAAQPAPTAFAQNSVAPADIGRAPDTSLSAASVSASQTPSEMPVVTARAGVIGHETGVAIARHVAADRGEMLVIRLSPAELGRVEVRLSTDDGGTLRAVVTADSPAALDMLRQDSARLDRALGDAGIRSDAQTLRFDDRQSDGGRQNGQAWQRQQNANRWNNGTATTTADADPQVREYRSVARGRVDMIA